MSKNIELWVNRKDFRSTQIVTTEIPAPTSGEIVVAIDKFGLTANNVSYAVSGDMIGYWGYFPATDDWGKVCVWGCANVIESNCEGIAIGERLWGFYPMASHVLLTPGNIRTDQFTDVTSYRQTLPELYNFYRRTDFEPDAVRQFENERCLLVPLFTTSFVIYDYLIYNDLFSADQIVIGSVSSKTGLGLAKMLHNDPNISAKIVGITSAGNNEFVEQLACCDQVITYGNEEELDKSLPSAYIDMSGNTGLTKRLHTLLGDNMVESAMVGATHWDKGGKQETLPGAKPKFFFAPGHIGTRDKEWGQGATMRKGMEQGLIVAAQIKELMHIHWVQSAEELEQIWLNMLDNKINPSQGLMVSLLSDE
jgi:hypothetical protein